MRASLCTLAVLSALTMLTACQKEPEPAPVAPAQPQAQTQTQQEASKPNAPPTAEAPASSSPALVQEPAVPQQDSAAQAIESKPFGEGTLALTKAKVVGQILNVEFIFTPPKKPNGDYKFTNVHSGELKDFAYIDETTSKRISLLQDENGKYMADPIGGAGRNIGLTGTTPKIIALKFPAPAETTPTITIDFPGAGSFDSVQVSR